MKNARSQRRRKYAAPLSMPSQLSSYAPQNAAVFSAKKAISPPGPPALLSEARMASSAAARRAAGSAISRIYSIPASYSPRVAVSSPRTNFHSGAAFPRPFGAMPEARAAAVKSAVSAI